MFKYCYFGILDDFICDFKYAPFLLKSKQAPPLIQICPSAKTDDHLYNRSAHVKFSQETYKQRNLVLEEVTQKLERLLLITLRWIHLEGCGLWRRFQR